MAATRRNESKGIIYGTIESDNHVDMWCFGPNFVMDHFTGHTCSVSGYNKRINSTKICIVTGLTLLTNQSTSRPHLPQVNQGLDMRHILDHTLANPNNADHSDL